MKGASILIWNGSNNYFQVRKNGILESVWLHWHNQEEDKSAEQCTNSLYSVADYCAYSELTDNLILLKLLSKTTAIVPRLNFGKGQKLYRA